MAQEGEVDVGSALSRVLTGGAHQRYAGGERWQSGDVHRWCELREDGEVLPGLLSGFNVGPFLLGVDTGEAEMVHTVLPMVRWSVMVDGSGIHCSSSHRQG
jgi:hypothetical protein